MTTSTTLNEREQAEIALLQRFARESRSVEPLTYEFTQDRALLHQYYQLREVMYRKVFNTDKFIGKEDVHDKISSILVVRQGKLVIGGCRITIREGDEEFALPMESHEFNLSEAFLEQKYCHMRHCEVSRFAILSDRFEKEIMHEMLRMVFKHLLENEVNYMFVKSILPMARNWRLIANNLGFTDNKIHMDIDLPENPIHPGLKWYLCRVNLPPVTAHKQSFNEANLAKAIQ